MYGFDIAKVIDCLSGSRQPSSSSVMICAVIKLLVWSGHYMRTSSITYQTEGVQLIIKDHGAPESRAIDLTNSETSKLSTVWTSHGPFAAFAHSNPSRSFNPPDPTRRSRPVRRAQQRRAHLASDSPAARTTKKQRLQIFSRWLLSYCLSGTNRLAQGPELMSAMLRPLLPALPLGENWMTS
jgi:hypothetical protein